MSEPNDGKVARVLNELGTIHRRGIAICFDMIDAQDEEIKYRLLIRAKCYSVSHKILNGWSSDGTLEKVQMALTETLEKRKKINMSECCIDAKFVPAKKGGICVGKTKCGKGTKLVAITEKRGRPVSVLITDASCHEVRLVEPALDACWTSENPQC